MRIAATGILFLMIFPSYSNAKDKPESCNKKYISASAARLRLNPSTSSDVLKHLKFEEPICVLDKDKIWVKIRPSGDETLSGWVQTEFVTDSAFGFEEARKKEKSYLAQKNIPEAVKWAERAFDIDSKAGLELLNETYTALREYESKNNLKVKKTKPKLTMAQPRIPRRPFEIQKKSPLDKWLSCKSLPKGSVNSLPELTPEDEEDYPGLRSDYTLREIIEKNKNLNILKAVVCHRFKVRLDGGFQGLAAGPYTLEMIAEILIKQKKHDDAKMILTEITRQFDGYDYTIGDVTVSYSESATRRLRALNCLINNEKPRRFSSPDEFVKALKSSLDEDPNQLPQKIFPCTTVSYSGGYMGGESGAESLTLQDVVEYFDEDRELFKSKFPKTIWTPQEKVLIYPGKILFFTPEGEFNAVGS